METFLSLCKGKQAGATHVFFQEYKDPYGKKRCRHIGFSEICLTYKTNFVNLHIEISSGMFLKSRPECKIKEKDNYLD